MVMGECHHGGVGMVRGVTVLGGTGTWWYQSHGHGRMPPWGCRDGRGVTVLGGTGTWWYQSHGHGRMPPWGCRDGKGGNHLGRYWNWVVSESY